MPATTDIEVTDMRWWIFIGRVETAKAGSVYVLIGKDINYFYV